MSDKIPLAQVIKGTQQLTNAQLREQTRPYIPSAIERLAGLCNSNNEGIALGAVKVMLAKNIPDLKAMALTGGDGEKLPFTVIINDTSDASKTK